MTKRSCRNGKGNGLNDKMIAIVNENIVRQMVECIKVYADKHIEVIFGGGYVVEETVE